MAESYAGGPTRCRIGARDLYHVGPTPCIDGAPDFLDSVFDRLVLPDSDHKQGLGKVVM